MNSNYFDTHLVVWASWISLGPLMWVWGWGCLSCYYPFLLSAKHYVVINNSALQELLISDQLNRSSNTKTRLVDRDKLPAIGAFYYIVGAILLGAAYLSGICIIIEDVSNTSSTLIHSLAALCPYLLAGIVLLGVFSFIFYLIDYGVGKLFDPNDGRL